MPSTLPSLDAHIERGDALIVVPPFAGLDRPALGAHVLQACARRAGFDVRVLYANMLLAREIGEPEYGAICFGSTANLLGERFFATAAYGRPPRVYGADGGRGGYSKPLPNELTTEGFAALASGAEAWCDRVAAAIAAVEFPVVGCTSTFEQTAASIALLDRVKALRPDAITIMGGANCEGAMADGIHSLRHAVDHVFSSESEKTFPAFLAAVAEGAPLESRVVHGEVCRAMDEVPTPDFTEYYDQLAAFLPEGDPQARERVWLPYESSRGCWWGEKSHCTFCGINGGGMTFRQKSPDRVIAELRELVDRHPTNLVCMVDNIMPHQYFKTLLPRLREELPGLHLFYEQKANLTLERVAILKEAGVAVIQPGIEALSTPLLKLMRKGVKAHQNIALLRYARSVDLSVNWNLLYAFPGDQASWYEETLEVMPYLAHLNPPTGLCHLSIDRFSPYFEQPELFGVANVRPMQAYHDVLPPDADHGAVAYHFQGDYESGSRGNASLVERIEAAIEEWRGRWESTESALPAFELEDLGDDLFVLADTRGLPGTPEFEFVDRAKAALALVGGAAPAEPADIDWALRRAACVELEGRLVPLATAKPALIAEFEAEASPREPKALPLAARVVAREPA